MATETPRALNEILEEAFRLRFEGDVRKALLDRVQVKKKIAEGMSLENLDPTMKAKVINAMQGTAAAEAEFALERAKKREARRIKGENLEFQQMEIGDPVLRRKRNPFGAVDAAKDLLIQKDRALFQ